MNNPLVIPTAESLDPHLPSQCPNGLLGKVTLCRRVPPLIHIPASIRAGCVGLVEHEIA